MRFTKLLLCGALALASSSAAMATIVDGVRQEPTYETSGFVTGVEGYLYNIGAGQFWTEGNAWGTQASVGSTGLLMRFSGSTDNYLLQNYSLTRSGWYYAFFDSETALFVDRNQQANYFFAVENRGSTFRLYTSPNNPTYGDYAGADLYVGLVKNSSSTALSPFVDEDEAYVDWAFVTKDAYNALASVREIYDKAQQLKEWIDKIEALNGDVSNLKTVYLNEDASIEELEAAISSAQPILIQALINNASDKENVDVTAALQNPGFEYGLKRTTDPKGYGGDYGVADGWVVDRNYAGNVTPGPLGTDYDSKMIEAIGRTNHCFEAWHCHDFDIYQEVVGLPVGVYEVEVQGYMRCEAPGYTRGDLNGLPNMPIYLYLNNAISQFPDVYSEKRNGWDFVTVEDWTRETINGYDYPNSMGAAAQCFAHGMYKKQAYGLIASGQDALRIGVRGKTDKDAWVIWDDFKLRYRGFKPDVVQPVLEEAMTDLNQYATMLMGKTEFAALTKALTDAQTAIDNQDGEAMFQALNALYDVKETVIASKDLFIEQEVATDLTSLQEAIAAVAEKKLSAATRTAATTLAAGIAGNTIYEGTQISQLKESVTNAIYALNHSVELYIGLETAISSLTTAITAKAQQSLIDEANELLPNAQAGYEAGSIASVDVEALVTSLNTKTAAIEASAAEYVKLNNAITRLKAAITEASAETARVSKSTLRKADLRLTASQKLYDEGTIADADIPARITSIDQLITELTHSIELYRQFNEGLTALQTALTIEAKMSAATRNAAQQVYDTALEAYNEGTVDDEQIEAQMAALNAQVTIIENSKASYADLAVAYPTLENVINLKALQTLVDEANTLYTTASEGYEAESIADNDIAGLIADIETIIPQVEASAVAYASLKEAIDRLETAIEEVGDQATKSSLKKANLRLTATKNLYNNGTIADADIPARIEAIDQLIEDLTASIRLRQQYDEAIENLDVAVSNAAVSTTMKDNATALQTTITTDYEEGNVDDANIEAEITKINNIIANLEAAADLYASIDAEQIRLNQLTENLDASQQTIASTEARSAEVYLATSEKTKFADALAENKDALNESIANKNVIANQLAETTALDVITLTADNTSTFVTIGAKITNMQGSISSELTTVDNIQSAVTKALGDAIDASQYIADIKGEFATFCSTADLDFTDVTGVKAYVASDFDADNMMVKMTQVTNVPAGTGILLVAEEAGEYQIPAGSSAADFTNILIGVTEATVVAATNGTNRNFILANGSAGVAFYPLRDGKLAAGKAYLPLPTAALNAGVKGISLTFEDLSTDIQHLLIDEESDGKWFDLSGKQLGHRPVKTGLYIHNGKKVVIK